MFPSRLASLLQIGFTNNKS